MTSSQLHTIARRLAERFHVDENDVRAVLAGAVDEVECNTLVTRRGYGCGSRYEADRPTGYITIPFMPKHEDAAPLKRVVARAADRANASQFTTIALMTFVWEAIASEVSSGNVVRIPGWGIYGPWRWNPKGDDPRDAVVYPRFVAARPFRQEVRGMCPPELAKNDVLRNFQRSHHPSSRAGGFRSRTITTMESWRGHNSRQSGGFA
jgi:hypothetical protein